MGQAGRILLLAAFGASIASDALALPASPSQRAIAFATCVGRYAAQATEPMIGQDGRASQRTFEELLEATLPAAYDYGMPEREVASARFLAWSHHAKLRGTAHYGIDPGRRDRAREMVARDMAECDALLL